MKKKNSIFAVVIMLLLLVTLAFACNKTETVVTFNTNGGSEIAPVTLTTEGFTLPTPPTKEGYVFDGWYTDEELTKAFDESAAITESITLYTKWKTAIVTTAVTISFDANGGSSTPAIETIVGGSIKLPVKPVLEGHTFVGWYYDEELTVPYSATKNITENFTLYAKWAEGEEIVTYEISFSGGVSSSGEPPLMENKPEGVSITLPKNTFTRKGYTFMGWKLGNSIYMEEDVYVMPSKSVTFSAQWEFGTKYTVSFTGGDNATGTAPAFDSVFGGKSFVFPENTFVNENCEFMGWGLGNDVYMVGESYDMPNNAISFEAKWYEINPKSVGLSYSLNEETNSFSITGYTGTSAEVLIPEIYNGRRIEKIDTRAFFEKTTITDVVMGNNITEIGLSAFEGCTSIESVEMSQNLIKIGEKAFSGCLSLAALTIVPSTTEIGSAAFMGCVGLTKIVYNSILCNRFSSENNVFGEAGTSGEGIEVVIGENVTALPDYLFYPNSKNASLSPKIKSLAFSGESCKKIGSYAFCNVLGLTSITIPSSIEIIGENAFSNCDMVTKLDFQAEMCQDFSAENGVFAKLGSDTDGVSITIGKKVSSLPAYFLYASADSSLLPKVTAVSFEEDGSCSYIGKYVFAGCTNLSALIIPESVRSLGAYSFYNCKGITSIILPKYLSNIWNDAFYGCDSLSDIKFNSVYCDNFIKDNDTFFGVGRSAESGLTVTIGKSVRRIPDYFIYSRNESVNLNRLLFEADGACETIGKYAFFGNVGLVEINLPEKLKKLGDGAFEGCTAVERINYSAVSCEDLTAGANYTFAGVGTRGAGASFSVGKDVESIPAYLFCPVFNDFDLSPKISAITFAENGKCAQIGMFAFSGIKMLREITLPKTLTKLGSYALAMCESLEMILVESGNTVYCDQRGVLFDINKTELICYPKGAQEPSFIIPSTVKRLSGYSFSGNENIASITIPASVTSIGNYSFNDCKNLVYVSYNAESCSDLPTDNYVFNSCGKDSSGFFVEVGDAVKRLPARLFYPSENSPKIRRVDFSPFSVCTAIGQYAFYGCKDLNSVIIPESVSEIERRAFGGCQSLTIYYKGETIPESGWHESWNLSSCPVYTNISDESFIEADDIQYVIENGSATVSRVLNVNSVALPSQVSVKGREYPLTRIGVNAFACSYVTDLTISENITSIGNRAFYDCSSLNRINYKATRIADFDENNEIFLPLDNQAEAVTFTVTAEIDRLPAYLFYTKEGRSLNITVADVSKAKEIGFAVFEKNDTLTELSLPFVGENETNDNTSYLGYLFGGDDYTSNSKVVPSSLTKVSVLGSCLLSENAFRGCSKITDMLISNLTTGISYGTFFGCDSMTELTLPFVGSSQNPSDDSGFLGYVFGGNDNTAVPNSLNSVKLNGDLAVVAENAFNNCTSIQNITFGSGVIDINPLAFSDCSNLVTLSVDEGNSYYSSNNGILFNNDKTRLVRYPSGKEGDEYNVADTVIEIGSAAFYGSKLNRINISAIVATIGDRAFLGNKDLTHINVAAENSHFSSENGVLYNEDKTSLLAYPAGNEAESFLVPDTVAEIKAYAFSRCSAEILWGTPQLRTVGAYAFSDYSGKELILPDEIIKIEKNALLRCDSLLKLTIPFVGEELSTENTSLGYIFGADDYTENAEYVPYSLKEIILTQSSDIAANAFRGCVYLKKIEIPESTQNIDTTAFLGCSTLEEILVAESNTIYRSDSGVLFNKGKTVLLRYPSGKTETNYSVSEEVLEIGVQAFENSKNIQSLTIGENVTEIGEKAFEGCIGVKYLYYNAKRVDDFPINNGIFKNMGEEDEEGVRLIIGRNVKSIPAYFFCPDTIGENTPKLLSMSFGSGNENVACTRIGDYAFAYASSLKSIVLPSLLEIIGNCAFYEARNVTTLDYRAVDAADLLEDNLVFYNLGLAGDGVALSVHESVEKIPSYIFCPGGTGGLTKLISVEFAENSLCSFFGKDCFKNCSRIESMVLPFVGEEKVNLQSPHFGYIFGATSYLENMTSMPDALKTVVINGTSAVQAFAFFGCNNLNSLTISKDVGSIGASAFTGCGSLITLSIPFVGNSKNGGSNNHFGFVFGATSGEDNSGYIPASLKTVNIDGGDLADQSFKGCTSIGTINLGEGVSRVTSLVFEDCIRLTAINVHENNSGFYSLNGVLFNKGERTTLLYYPASRIVKSYIIPTEVSRIGDYAFVDALRLESVTISANVVDIGYRAFGGCVNLSNVYFNAKNCSDLVEGNNVFENVGFALSSGVTLTVGNEATKLPAYLFSSVNTLKAVDFSQSIKLKQIGVYAFNNCYNLFKLELPTSLELIGRRAFYGLSIESLIIPDSVKTIGSEAFAGCSDITVLTLGKGVKNLDNGAFNGLLGLQEMYYYAISCNDLLENNNVFFEAGRERYTTGEETANSGFALYIGNEVTAIPNYFFYSNTLVSMKEGDREYFYLPKVKTISFVQSVNLSRIGSYAFTYSFSLTSVVIPKNVVEIGSYAFAGDSLTNRTMNLSSLSFEQGSKCTTIKSYAFAYNNQLTSIRIPEKMEQIENGAFINCNFSRVYVLSKTIAEHVNTKPREPDTNGYNYGGLLYKASLIYIEAGILELSDDLSNPELFNKGTISNVIAGYTYFVYGSRT